MRLQLRQTQWHLYHEVFVLVGMGIAIFLLTQVGWVTPLENFFRRLLNPISRSVPSVIQFIEQPFYSFNHMYSSTAELSVVKEKYAVAQAELAELEELRLENQQLRQMIENRHLSLEERIIAAPVASYAYPAVAAGSVDGIQEGSLIVVADTLLGRVTNIQETQSRVELLSNQEAQPVLAKTESGIQGLVQGTGRAVVLTQLPPDVDIKTGERVVSLGQPGVEPGMFLGIVTVVQSSPTSPVKTVGIDQLVSFYTTPLVEVW